MNFDYNEEQQLLADSVRRYLQKDYDFEARKKILATPQGWSERVWATFAEMGLTGLPLSPDHGGFGGGAIDLMSVMEAFGEALVVEPYLPTVIASLLISRSGDEKQKKAIMPLVAEGKMRLALAIGERGGMGAAMADRVVIVRGDAVGIGMPTILRSHSTVDDIAAAVSGVEKTESLNASDVEEVVDIGAALSCAEAVSAMKFASDTTLEYLKTRKQFD